MRTRDALAWLLLALPVAAACEEENPFEAIPEQVDHGTDQIWQLGFEGFPSGFDLATGTRFFVGPSRIDPDIGTFVLDQRADGTLIFRPYSTLASQFSSVRVGMIDLGARSFESVTVVPESGYSAPTDSLGVPVVQGHTYAFRVSTRLGAVTALNYGKIHVVQVARQVASDPASRFVRFEWAYQRQPQDRDVAVEEEET